MRYIRVEWLHSNPDEPILLYSELDDEGHELRKVEIFRDGHAGFASESETAADTLLGEKPVPPLQEIAEDPQFRPASISREEFGKIWSSHWRPTRKATG
jgi:hypothetical protein